MAGGGGGGGWGRLTMGVTPHVDGKTCPSQLPRNGDTDWVILCLSPCIRPVPTVFNLSNLFEVELITIEASGLWPLLAYSYTVYEQVQPRGICDPFRLAGAHPLQVSMLTCWPMAACGSPWSPSMQCTSEVDLIILDFLGYPELSITCIHVIVSCWPSVRRGPKSLNPTRFLIGSWLSMFRVPYQIGDMEPSRDATYPGLPISVCMDDMQVWCTTVHNQRNPGIALEGIAAYQPPACEYCIRVV